MSKTKREPLVSNMDLTATDDRVRRATLGHVAALEMVRDHYEAARAKDAKLIQQLVDAWYSEDGGPSMHEAIADAAAQGFTRTMSKEQTNKRKHTWRGCRSFLAHDNARKTVYCTVCGRSNVYVVKEEYPYVNFKGWNEGRIIWFLIPLIVLIPAAIVFIITLIP